MASFSAPVTFELNQSNGIAVADFNGDGRPDVAIGGNPVEVLTNQTAPGASAMSVGAPVYLPAGTGFGGALTTADLNGDGRPDLITAAGGAQVLMNTTPPGAAAPSFSAPIAVPLLLTRST